MENFKIIRKTENEKVESVNFEELQELMENINFKEIEGELLSEEYEKINDDKKDEFKNVIEHLIHSKKRDLL